MISAEAENISFNNYSKEMLNSHSLYLSLRRIVELCIVLFTLPFVLPVCILLIVIIKFGSSGKIFYKQDRPGLKGEIFKIYKFRTLRHNFGSGNLPDLENQIIPLGHFIRKHRLDEIPQFINVLKGNMSLIGPRPEAISYFFECSKQIPEYNNRLCIRPGITGWAQVNYSHTLDIEGAKEKFKYDMHYLRNISFKMDLYIFIKTISVVFKGSGGK